MSSSNLRDFISTLWAKKKNDFKSIQPHFPQKAAIFKHVRRTAKWSGKMFQYRVLSQYRNKYSSTEIALPGSRLKYFPRPLCGPTHVFENGGLLWKVWLYASKIGFFFAQSAEIKSRKLELLIK